jgi:hypothetical protein
VPSDSRDEIDGAVVANPVGQVAGLHVVLACGLNARHRRNLLEALRGEPEED